jgi:hypothetical protein
LLCCHLIQIQKNSWKHNVIYECLFMCQIIIIIFFLELFCFISLQIYILGYNIISFSIPKDDFLNFETK